MRIALIADTHLSVRSPECVANWHAAGRAVERLGADLTVNLGDITLDGQTHADELAYASRLMQKWPTEVRCVPGNHDLGDGSGESPFDERLLLAYRECFGPDHWVLQMGSWKLLGINAQLLGSDTAEESALWAWIEEQARPAADHESTALFLHRPMLRSQSSEIARQGRYVSRTATERLLKGPMQPTLRLVVSGHAHQYLDTMVEGVRHLWIPSTAFILPDDMQSRIGEKLVGIGLLQLGEEAAQFDLWCPDGMRRHDVSALEFFNAAAVVVSTASVEGSR
jgi:3',5'-cyclic AMP phosphodiesterase CpdA